MSLPNRLNWELRIFDRRGTDKTITVQACVPNTGHYASVDADLYAYWTMEGLQEVYKVEHIPKDAWVWRICRVIARPRHQGGGTAVMQAYCAHADQNDYWTVLEASPYYGQDRKALIEFYMKYSFVGSNGLMYRRPQKQQPVL